MSGYFSAGMNAGILQNFAVGCVCSGISETNHHNNYKIPLIGPVLGAYMPENPNNCT